MRGFGAAITATLILLAAVPARAQDPPPLPHTSLNAWKCKSCAPALLKALEYLRQNGSQANGYSHFFMGWTYLVSGRHPKELRRCIQRMSGDFYKRGGFNGNWATCMSALFLSEIYRRAPTLKLRDTLVDILRTAEAGVEPTGGWCHNKGMAMETGYHTRGGGVDLGILTCMMYGAMLNLKSARTPVPDSLFQNAEKNLETLFDGMGIRYGTENQVGDTAMGRASFAYLGIHAARHTSSPLAKGVPKGLKSRTKKTHDGHAYPPLHFTSVALASHLCGADTYNRFAKHWIDRLIARQKEDGSVKLPHTENGEFQERDKLVSSTAAFALILLLQEPGSFEHRRKKEKKVVKGGLGLKRKPVATSVGRAWLGVRVAESFVGAEVKEVVKGSPAQKAGVRAGDYIVGAGGHALEDLSDLRERVGAANSGAPFKLEILRAGEIKALELVPASRPARAGSKEL